MKYSTHLTFKDVKRFRKSTAKSRTAKIVRAYVQLIIDNNLDSNNYQMVYTAGYSNDDFAMCRITYIVEAIPIIKWCNYKETIDFLNGRIYIK
jgi:hypothetical protein